MIWTESPAVLYCYHKVQRRKDLAPRGAGKEDGAVFVAVSVARPRVVWFLVWFCFLLFGCALWHVGP